MTRKRSQKERGEAMNRFGEVVVTGLVAFTLVDAGSALAQRPSSVQSNTQTRTRAIVASFNKRKHAVKEKYGVRVEKYKEIRSEPAIRANVRDYAGSYEVPGMGLSLDLKMDANGNVAATGYEQVNGSVWREFTLRNARIEGALLTATKVYASGATEPFEGVFINSTSFDSPTDRGVTTFGLGVLGSSRVVVGGVSTDRFFYQRKR
jgi:hypothetical protein